MEWFKEFYGDFKSAFVLNDYISNYSIGRITGEFISIAIIPFIVTIILGLISIVTNDKWDAVLFRVIEEFIQMTGFKLFIYIILIITGIGLITYRFEVLTKITTFVMNILAKFGFALNAVFTGTFSGIMIIDLMNSKGSYFFALFYPFSFVIFIIFIGVAKLFSSSVRAEINSTFGKHTNILTVLFGIVLTSYSLYSLLNEPWLEIGL